MTLAELRIAAMQEAGILAAGESASPEDDQLCAEKYAALYEMLLGEDLVAWAADEDIPPAVEIPMTMMLAAFIAPAFGVLGQKLADLRAGGAVGMPLPSIAERMLRRQLARSDVAGPVKTEYF